MSSETPAATLGDLYAQGGRDAAAFLSSGAPAATEAPAAPPPAPEAPAPVVAAPAAPPSVGAPTDVKPATPETSNIDPSSWTSEARRALEMEGWDGRSPVTPDLIQKLAGRYLDFNNRLAADHRAAKAGEAPAPLAEPTAPVAPVVAAPPPAPVVPPAPPVETELAQIPARVAAELESDPVASRMIEQYVANQGRLAQLVGDDKTPSLIRQATFDLFFERRRLETPEVKSDPVLTDEVSRRVMQLELQNERLLTERARLDLVQQTLTRDYDQKHLAVTDRHRSQIEERAAVTRRAEELSQRWPSMLERALETNKVPAEDREDIKARINRVFIASVRSGAAINEIEAFMDTEAKNELKVRDAYHRRMMGTYGAQAHARTETVTPPPSNGTAPATASTHNTDTGRPLTLADLEQRGFDALLRANRGG